MTLKNNHEIEKKEPLRMCVSCRERKPKRLLLRIVKKDSGYTIDIKHKIQSRGIYVCDKIECVDKLSKNKKWNVNIAEEFKKYKSDTL